MKSSRTLSRRELYKLVWSTPVRRLAKDFGLSDVGLSKVCRKYSIPTPPVGYWAKKQHGAPARRKPLPRPNDGSDPSITIPPHPPRRVPAPPEWPPYVRDPAIAAKIVEVMKPENQVLAAADALRSPHPLVAALRLTPGRDGLVDRYGRTSPPPRGGEGS